jgi:hypothetical protein
MELLIFMDGKKKKKLNRGSEFRTHKASDIPQAVTTMEASPPPNLQLSSISL